MPRFDPTVHAEVIKTLKWAHGYLDGDPEAIEHTVHYMAEQVLLSFPDFTSVKLGDVHTPIQTEYAVQITRTVCADPEQGTEEYTYDYERACRNRAEAEGEAARLSEQESVKAVHRLHTGWVPIPPN